MAYVPDEWAIRPQGMSPTTRDLLLYYCMRAHQVTGQTNVSVQRASQDLGVRKDHVDEHDRKLLRGGYVQIEKDENGGRIVRLCGPWQSSEQRKRKPLQVIEKPASSQVLGKTPQDLGTPLDSSPSFGESPQNLGESPQNLGESPQNLGAHVKNNQPMNPPMEPGGSAREPQGAPGASTPRRDFPGEPPFSTVSPDAELTAIEAMTDAVFHAYAIKGNVDQRFERQIVEQIGRLNGLGCTPAQLTAFFSQRARLPSLNHLVTDWQTWSANEQRAANGIGGANGREQRPRETHNARAARKTFEWLGIELEPAPEGDRGADSVDAEAPLPAAH